MFELSIKSIYGLLALIEIAENSNKKPIIQIKDIVNNKNIPINYLEQLLLILKKSGFLKSIRGKKGGYALATHLRNIKIYDVLTTLEGELKIIPEGENNDFLKYFWNQLEIIIKKYLDISLEEFLLEKEKFKNNLTYII